MAGTGLLDFAWYDYPWLLLILSLPFVIGCAIVLNLLLWLSIRPRLRWPPAVLVTGFWGFALAAMFLIFYSSKNLDGLLENLIVPFGFAVPLHLLTIAVWFGYEFLSRPRLPGWLTVALYLQPAVFGIWVIFLIGENAAVTNRKSTTVNAPAELERWMVQPDETTTQLVWPVGKKPVNRRAYRILCDNNTEVPGVTGKDGLIDLTVCTPAAATEIVVGREMH